jgi:hypothetical protein
MYKRTTNSGKNGTRTTRTQSVKGSKRSSKMSQSVGGKTSRITTTTNLNTGERKTYITQKSGGWISRKSLSPPKQKPQKPKKVRVYRSKKSKPLGTTGWVILAVIIILLAISWGELKCHIHQRTDPVRGAVKSVRRSVKRVKHARSEVR